MREPVYDLIIGNISGVRNQSEPNPQWCRRENRENCREILQAVQTQGQKAKEEKGLKKLNVTDLVDLEITVNKMKELQLIDETLTNYRNLANAGKRKLFGDGIVSWFSMDKGLLYRYFSSPKVSDNKTFKQFVIPEALRRKVMHTTAFWVDTWELRRLWTAYHRVSIGWESKVTLNATVSLVTSVNGHFQRAK